MYRTVQPRYCSISDACEAIEYEDGKELEVLFEDSCQHTSLICGSLYFFLGLLLNI